MYVPFGAATWPYLPLLTVGIVVAGLDCKDPQLICGRRSTAFPQLLIAPRSDAYVSNTAAWSCVTPSDEDLEQAPPLSRGPPAVDLQQPCGAVPVLDVVHRDDLTCCCLACRCEPVAMPPMLRPLMG